MGMTRYVALLRGVSPQNAKSADLVRAFESAGLTKVRTVLSSGNVVFDSRTSSEARLTRQIEDALQQSLGRSFRTILRTRAFLQELLDADPFAAHAVPEGAKRVVSFLPDVSTPRMALPLSADGAFVLQQAGREVFTAYVPSEKGPVFMQLIEKAFGSEVTTRTWDTVRKCSVA